MFVLILSPVRELCIQIQNELATFLNQIPFIVSGVLMGGESVKKEKSRIRKGINIVIATPSRFLYHLNNTKSLFIPNLQYIVKLIRACLKILS
jgi:ATP-dependent RNA helicase DDX31/DBP7